MKQRIISSIEKETQFVYSVSGKKIREQNRKSKKLRSLGQSTKKNSNVLPEVQLTLGTDEVKYQMHSTDQLFLPPHNLIFPAGITHVENNKTTYTPVQSQNSMILEDLKK